jgi:hypothetical protein
MNDDPDAEDWKRREHALAYALITWAFGVVALLFLAPEATIAFIQREGPFATAGVIMLTVGLLGGIFDYGQQLAADWQTTDDEDLTTPPWEAEE